MQNVILDRVVAIGNRNCIYPVPTTLFLNEAVDAQESPTAPQPT